jgi:hypothetical protein
VLSYPLPLSGFDVFRTNQTSGEYRDKRQNGWKAFDIIDAKITRDVTNNNLALDIQLTIGQIIINRFIFLELRTKGL